MDPFDDLLPVAPAARTRPGGKFVPKAKLKQLPAKEIQASEHATSSKDGILGSECQNAVASTLNMPAEKSKGSVHLTRVEILNSEMGHGHPKPVAVKGNSAASVDDSTITASEVDADQNSTNFLKPVFEADLVDFEGGSVTNFVPETSLNNGTAQPVHPANAEENKLNKVAAPSANTCSTIGRMKEPPKNEEGLFLDSNKCLELIDNSLQVDTDLGFKSSSNNKVAMIQSIDDSKLNFGKEQEVISSECELDPFSNILADPGARNAHKFKPKMKARPRVVNTPAIASASSNVTMEKSVALPSSCTNNFQSFQSCGDDSGGLNQSTSLPLLTSEILRTTDLPNKFDDTSLSVPLSEDNKSLAAAISSQLNPLNAMNSEDAVHNGTRDWPSSFGKSSGEAADIFSGLESLDDVLTQAATDMGKAALHSFSEKGAEENFVTPACSSINSLGESDTTKVQRCPEYHCPQDSLTFNEAAVLNEVDTHTNNRRAETEEIVDFSPSCPGDVFDYQSKDSGGDRTSGIVHEELTNAADSLTLADFLQADVTREKGDTNKRKRDGSTSCSQRKNKDSSIVGEEDKGGKTLRQLRKQAVCIPANSSWNEDVEGNTDLNPSYNSNENELQENDDDYEVDHSSKKKKVSTSSQKRSVAKGGKTSQKRRGANDDLEKTKEHPKKFSHSMRRRKRSVNKALLEIPEDELDHQRLPMRDVILLAEHRERLTKKEATTSNNSPTNQSGGDSLHEAGAYNEWEFSGSEDGRDPYDDQSNEGITTSSSQLFNYQFLQEKTPKGNWSKQDTERFYEAVRTMGTDFSMIQLLFPDKTRQQIKLKFKNEDRKNRLCLDDAINNHAKDHCDLWVEQVKLASTKAEEDPSGDASEVMMAEEVVDLTARTNDVATNWEDADVKAQEDSVAVHSAEQSDDSGDDIQIWSRYKSNY